MPATETVETSPTLKLASTSAWRSWLERNGQKKTVIWLIIHHKASKTPSVHWHDAIEHALCYGWVESKAKSRDKESCYLKFTPRNPKSKWGERSKERAARMTALGLMTEHGQRLIDLAKASGKWISEPG